LQNELINLSTENSQLNRWKNYRSKSIYFSTNFSKKCSWHLFIKKEKYSV